ncbi:MAG: hypothetical protein ACI9S8_000613 [Chlamydiales bacterium]|jgi:hypothetical protein
MYVNRYSVDARVHPHFPGLGCLARSPERNLQANAYGRWTTPYDLESGFGRSFEERNVRRVAATRFERGLPSISVARPRRTARGQAGTRGGGKILDKCCYLALAVLLTVAVVVSGQNSSK